MKVARPPGDSDICWRVLVQVKRVRELGRIWSALHAGGVMLRPCRMISVAFRSNSFPL